MIEKKYLLSEIRNGDYTHAGDEEAIKMVLPFLSNKVELIDIGCGLGGTAYYLSQHLNCNILGIDKDPKAIGYARDHYPKIEFDQIDVNFIFNHFDSNSFDAAIFFNSFYALKAHQKTLHDIDQLIMPKGTIIIFEYASYGQFNEQNPFLSTADKLFNPVDLAVIKAQFGRDYKVNIIDITKSFIVWYQNTIRHLENKKDTLIKKYGKPPFIEVLEGFNSLITLLNTSKLFGVLIVATKKI